MTICSLSCIIEHVVFQGGLFMYRVIKALNNNSLLVLTEENQEAILMGKGLGFGRKSGERLADAAGAKAYVLQNDHDKNSALQTVNGIAPVYIEIATRIIDLAQAQFLKVNQDILLPMADHIALAVKRVQEGTMLPNPFHQDIITMFPEGYAVARQALAVIKELTGVELPADEAGYLSLHVHAGLSADNVAASLACARLAARVVHRIEEALDCNFSKDTFKYSRLISHVHYMLLRIERGEKVAIDINDYVAKNFPEASTLAQDICTFVACEMKKTVSQEELTLLALHIQRVM